jgi:uncharacterized protein (DUF433 family)
MASEAASILSLGAYRLSEVAKYTGLTFPRVRSWFTARPNVKLQPIFRSERWGAHDEHVVTFLDMIDTWVAGRLRDEGVRMAMVRLAHAELQKRLRTPHPFAHSSIYTDGRRVLSDAAEVVNDRTMIDVVSRQGFLPQMKDMLTCVEYGRDSKLVERWCIARGVVIDPRVGMGHPVSKGTGVATRVLANCLWANGNDESLVAELFGVAPQQVRDAAEFERNLGRRSAA